MKMKTIILSLMLVIGSILTGCNFEKVEDSNADPLDQKLTVYTTIFPLQDFTQKIGGDFVDVKSIYPTNVDAHIFEPSTKDMIKLAEADLFIYTGAGIEGFAEKAMEALKNEKVTIIKAIEGISLLKLDHDHAHEDGTDHTDEEHHDDEAKHSEEEHHEDEAEHSEEEHHEDEANHSDEEHHEDETNHSDEEQHEDETHTETEGDSGNYDPHVWLDPTLSIKMAANIKDSLVKLSPENESEFEQNFLELRKDLEALDNEYKTVIDGSSKKYLLVAHEAYGYWANRYGITQIAVNGLSSTQEPSQRELSNLIKEAKAHKIKYIAFEQNVSPRVAEIIQKEIGAETVILHNLESITDEDIKKNEDYLSLMKRNLATLKKALN